MRTAILLIVINILLFALLARQEHLWDKLNVKAELLPSFGCGNAAEMLPKSGNIAKINDYIPSISNSNIKGKALFLAKCASCHSLDRKQKCGNELRGVENRWVGRENLLKQFIRNSQKVIRSGDAYANALYNEYGKTKMPAFPNLSDEEIDDILEFISVIE
jgi:cytochrome c2